MSNTRTLRRTERRVMYYHHAREYINQLRDAERRRRATIASLTSLGLTEERLLEILARNIIGYADKRRIHYSRSAFNGVLAKFTTISLFTTATLNKHHQETCTICLMEYDTTKQIRHMKCEHFFHRKCVDRWLQQYLTCPLCRRGILGNHYIFPPGQTSSEPPPEDPSDGQSYDDEDEEGNGEVAEMESSNYEEEDDEERDDQRDEDEERDDQRDDDEERDDQRDDDEERDDQRDDDEERDDQRDDDEERDDQRDDDEERDDQRDDDEERDDQRDEDEEDVDSDVQDEMFDAVRDVVPLNSVDVGGGASSSAGRNAYHLTATVNDDGEIIHSYICTADLQRSLEDNNRPGTSSML